MPTFIVKGAGIKKENIQGTHGPMKTLNLFLQEYGVDGPEAQTAAEWYTKQDTPIPAEGSTLDGTIEHDPKYGPKFKKAYAGGARGGGGGGYGGMTPERQRAIQRQHSQDMAIETLKLAGSLGLLPDVKTTADLFPLLKGTADWFDKDADQASHRQPEGER